MPSAIAAKIFTIGDEAGLGSAVKAVKGLAGKRSAVMLANHGPVVAGKDVEAACYAIDELEETAKLALMTRGISASTLSEGAIRRLVREFNVEWDD